jgi:VanZ family protein
MKSPVRKTRAERWLLWSRIALIGYWASLFLATHWPRPPRIVISGGDKMLHFVAYAGLAVLWGWAVALTRKPRRADWLRILLILAVYGAIDELLQGPVGRSPETADWLADLAAAAAGLLAIALALPLLRRLGLPLAAVSPDYSRHR